MLPNPGCPDCRGKGEVLMLNGTVPCVCTERDAGLEVRLEAARQVMAPEKLVLDAYDRVVIKARSAIAPEPEQSPSRPISVNGFRVEVGVTLFLHLSGVIFRVVNEGEGKLDVALVTRDAENCAAMDSVCERR